MNFWACWLKKDGWRSMRCSSSLTKNMVEVWRVVMSESDIKSFRLLKDWKPFGAMKGQRREEYDLVPGVEEV